jgi:hypothetical protein
MMASYLRLYLLVVTVLLIISSLLPSVSSFGARLEPISSRRCSSKRGYYNNYLGNHHDGSLLLVLQARHQKDSTSKDLVSFDQMMDLLDFPPAAFENLNDFSLAYTNGFSDGTFSHLQEQADILAFEAFEDNMLQNYWDDCGDDCEECMIPEEWKIQQQTVNVMEILGISRVKPLRVSVSNAAAK